ncbi:response regulator [Gracilimonas sp.]|uniref:response regulator n=1 Tax=Gracilimonas sp. TaxID=1974203 RepID=UPI002872A603|nr:response regulator [Gracilimonas sp.]
MLNNKILLVEDDPELRDTLQDVFELSGIEADISKDAKGALRCIEKEENRYNLILSDYLMPGMNGLLLFSEIRKLRKYENTPFYIISARTDKENKDKCRQAGVSGFIEKPFNISELVKLTSRYVKK